MTLSHPAVLELLRRDFVCGYANNRGRSYCGNSARHAPGVDAMRTTNGAGPHNTQTFVLSPDGVVLHCLLGFWYPEDFLHELALARVLHGVWTDAALSRAEKDARFRALHLEHAARHPAETVARSVLQGFDEEHELSRDAARRLQAGARELHVRDRMGRAMKLVRALSDLGQQLFLLSPDDRVLHCVLGTWHPDDLAHEIVFAKKMNKVWQLDTMTPGEKAARFAKRHGEQAADWPARGATQAVHELCHARMAARPFVELSRFDLARYTDDGRLSFALEGPPPVDPPVVHVAADGARRVKSADVILHERMARRPFVRFEDFDVAAFSDYGRLKYDKPPKLALRPGEAKPPRPHFFDTHMT